MIQPDWITAHDVQIGDVVYGPDGRSHVIWIERKNEHIHLTFAEKNHSCILPCNDKILRLGISQNTNVSTWMKELGQIFQGIQEIFRNHGLPHPDFTSTTPEVVIAQLKQLAQKK